MDEKISFDWKKFFKGVLISYAVLIAITLVFAIILFLFQGLTIQDYASAILSFTIASLMFWMLPALIGGFMYVRKGRRGIVLTIGITLAIVVLVFATCVASLSNLFNQGI